MMTFEQLDAWREAKTIAVSIYKIGHIKPLANDFSLRDQIQRSAVSVMSNIAESYERLHKAEKRQSYNIARASCGELRSQIHLIHDVQFISPESYNLLIEQSNRVGRLISGLIRSLDN